MQCFFEIRLPGMGIAKGGDGRDCSGSGFYCCYAPDTYSQGGGQMKKLNGLLPILVVLILLILFNETFFH